MFAFSRRSAPVIIVLLLLGAGLLLPITCMYGQIVIPAAKVLAAMAQLAGLDGWLEPGDKQTLLIVGNIRLARGIVAFCCGASLSLSGVILQGVLRNPLADPFTLGISAGAACGASLAIAASLSVTATPEFHFVITAAALAGSFLALGAALLLGHAAGGLERDNVILAGIAVAAFLGSVVALVKALNEESVTSIVFWIMGSLQGAGWHSLPILLVTFIPGAILACFGWRWLDLLSLGDAEAASLGLLPGRARFCLLLAASIMASGCVAVAGVIGFVGLVAPHILRLLMGGAHGPLLLASVPAGGIFLLFADCLARTILDGGQELPVGVVTSLAGAPFFAFLIWQRQRTV